MGIARKLYTGDVVTMVATATIEVKDVVIFGDSIGVALMAGEAGDTISVDTVGVYELPAFTDDEINVGTVLYWDESETYVTIDSDSGANVRAGVSWNTKGSGVAGVAEVKIG